MDLTLEFRNEVISGEGLDGIGDFVLSGVYCPNSLECIWDKAYVGKHMVNYKGYREGRGIWGLWTTSATKGGFHIWPLTEALPLETLEEEDSVEYPLADAWKF